MIFSGWKRAQKFKLTIVYFRDLEKLLGEADQFVDTMDIGLNREDIEDVVNDLASGGYSDEEFQEDLKIAAGAATKLYENIATTGELPSMVSRT